jgi:hypothetical protein
MELVVKNVEKGIAKVIFICIICDMDDNYTFSSFFKAIIGSFDGLKTGLALLLRL